MKRMKLMLVSVLAVLTMGLAVAQKATPISDFEYELTKDGMGISLKKYKGTDTEIVMPSEIEGIPVTELPKGMGPSFFSNSNKIVYVVLPSTITELPELFFVGCRSLKKVTLPDGLKKIGARAFERCESLTSIQIPDSVTEFQWDVFGSCSSLEKVTLPKNITRLSGTFANCGKLESLTIPNSVTEIGSYTFSGCTSLKSVNIPASCTEIDKSAFKNCRNLTEIIIPETIGEIKFRSEDCFRGCTSLPLATQAKLRRLGYKGEF